MRETKRFEIVREILLPRERVWQVLSNTDHLNRAIGLPAVDYEPPTSELTRQAKAKFNGLTLRWNESPFEWVKGEKYSIRRQYSSGPLKEFHGGVDLQDGSTPNATHVRIWADLTPANALGAALIPVMARSSLDKTWKYCRRALVEGDAIDALNAPLPQPVISSPVNENRLQNLVGILSTQSGEPHLAEKLADFLRTRGDDEVAQIKPHRLAAQWNEDHDRVLRVCLHGVKCGLLNLSWNLMCPNCRVSKAQVSSLSQLREQAHCDLCGIHFDVNFDRYVELRFTSHPGVRVANEKIYCIAGPFLMPHILMQKKLAPQSSTPLPPFAAHEAWRVRVPGVNHIATFSDAAKATDLAYENDGWTAAEVLPPRADGTLEITNRTDKDLWVVLEKVAWDDEAVTAARVTAMPEFRELFSSEVLAPGRHIAIQNLTLLFSDLRDSTQLYEREGDAPAYGCVRRHFDFLLEWIEKNNGAIVKTMGDAVMAVFQSPHEALRAALEIQKRVADFNASLPSGQSIRIKFGLHHGPAIAINSNERLDYFGSVVNIASRLGSVSKGDDVILSESCFDDENVRIVLREYSAAMETFQTQLKGIEGEVTLYRAHWNEDANLGDKL